MLRTELEHIIRASGSITDAKEIVIIGSQAILGQFPTATGILTDSIEADVFTFRDPQDAEAIDGGIGELSAFHTTFGYYAHGVAEHTAVLPPGWRERLIHVSNENTGGTVGLCLEVHDLCVSKLVAGREKDLNFVRAAILENYATRDLIAERLRGCPLPLQRLEFYLATLTRLAR